jgi:hypothetical protein
MPATTVGPTLLTPVPGSSSGTGAGPSSAAEAEAALLHGARLDLQGRCAPLRDGLPDGAVGAVTCTPADDVAASVTLTMLETRERLMDAYAAIVADNAIPAFSHEGRCEPGRASEGGYVPGDGHPGAIPDERAACWIDEAGTAHAALTSPPFVLLRVDGGPGAGPDTAFLYAMRGNRDAPGGPTLWAQEPMSPEK